MRDLGACRKAACCEGRLALGDAGFVGDFLQMAWRFIPLASGRLPHAGEGRERGRVASAEQMTLTLPMESSVLSKESFSCEGGIVVRAKTQDATRPVAKTVSPSRKRGSMVSCCQYAQLGELRPWIPAFAGMTIGC